MVLDKNRGNHVVEYHFNRSSPMKVDDFTICGIPYFVARSDQATWTTNAGYEATGLMSPIITDLAYHGPLKSALSDSVEMPNVILSLPCAASSRAIRSRH